MHNETLEKLTNAAKNKIRLIMLHSFLFLLDLGWANPYTYAYYITTRDKKQGFLSNFIFDNKSRLPLDKNTPLLYNV